MHLIDSFDKILGEHWREWFTLYVDDLGVHGKTENQALNRGLILEAMLTVLNKPFSDKTGNKTNSSMDLAGLHFTEHGVRLSDDSLASLEQCLKEYPVKKVSDIQHIVGVIQYANSAFEWPDRVPSPEFSELLSQLNVVTKENPRSLPNVWKSVYPPIRDRLLTLMKNRPWAYCDPHTIIDDDHCLMMTTDASDTAVAVSLFRVNRSDAANVSKADLLDGGKSQLIAVTYKKLNKAAVKWHTFESELYGIVLGCKKFGNYITTATVKYPPGGPNKIGIWSDSTTALGQWRTVSLPTAVSEHLSAKARRFNGWADKVAYTRYWPLVTRHLPGNLNDISHVLSHLGEQASERQRYLDQQGVSALAFPANLHTFHDGPNADPTDSLHRVHLKLTKTDVTELERAYLNDHTLIHSVPLSDIYKVVTNHQSKGEVPSMHRHRIATWANKRFFAVKSETGAGTLLFAPSAATVNKYPDAADDAADATRHLVMVVPAGADVRITTTAPVAEAGSGKHYADHDLRRDLVIHCHDNGNHASVADTHKQVRSMAWFPGITSFIKYHCDSCAYCVAKRKSTTPVGTAVRCARRLKLVEFDHKILPDDVAASVGYPAILTVVGVVSRVTLFIPVKDLTAETTARALFTRWYPLFGVPAIFRCDGAPAYTSEVMAAFGSIIGVKHVDVSSPDDPTHHSVVERRNRIMEKMIDVAVSKGDLSSAADMDMYCAAATAACNLEYLYKGHTVLEYLTGEIPRTRSNLAHCTEQIPDVLGTVDSSFLRQLRSLLREQHLLVQFARDDNSRYNALVRDATAGHASTTTFDLRPGDDVSYEGQRYQLLELLASTPTEPTKAHIRAVSHEGDEELTVKFSTLRPLASPRPVHMHTARTDVQIGQFVFFSNDDTPHVHGGTVTGLSDTTVTVHEHRQAKQVKRRFTPLYRDSATGKFEVKVKPLKQHTPVSVTLPLTGEVAVGSIDNYHISAPLLDTLKSLGVLEE